jgi:hypothetical protein
MTQERQRLAERRCLSPGPNPKRGDATMVELAAKHKRIERKTIR